MTHIQQIAAQIMGSNATLEELSHAEQVLIDRPEILEMFEVLFSLPDDKQAAAISEILKLWGVEAAR